jgi:hypothetical protein
MCKELNLKKNSHKKLNLATEKQLYIIIRKILSTKTETHELYIKKKTARDKDFFYLQS